MAVKTTRTATEEQLPTREEAEAAFALALDARQERVRAALNKLASDPPQVSDPRRRQRGRALQRGPVARRPPQLPGRAAALPALPGLPPDRREFVSRPVCAGRARRLHQDRNRPRTEDHPRGSAARRRQARRYPRRSPVPRRGSRQRASEIIGGAPARRLFPAPRPAAGSASSPRLSPVAGSSRWRGPRPARLRRRSCSSGKRRWRNSWPPGRGGSTRRPARVPSMRRWPAGSCSPSRRAQAALHAGRDGGPLGRRLAILPEAGHLHVNDLLAQCQESLDYMVSPPLVLNWLATRLHIVYRHARLRGRKRTA